MGTTIKTEIANVPGLGAVVCTVAETKLANGTVAVRVLRDARYAAGGQLVENEHRDTVAQFIRAN